MICEQQRALILKLYNKGKSYGYISIKLNIPKSTVHFVIKVSRKSHKRKTEPKCLIDKRLSLKIKIVMRWLEKTK